jgi:hypothetical protein
VKGTAGQTIKNREHKLPRRSTKDTAKTTIQNSKQKSPAIIPHSEFRILLSICFGFIRFARNGLHRLPKKRQSASIAFCLFACYNRKYRSSGEKTAAARWS